MLAAMRWPWFALVVVASGCGRIGYDPIAAEDGDGGVDAGPPPGVHLACGVPTLVAPLPSDALVETLDVAATTTGFVAVWGSHPKQLTTGLAVHHAADGPYLETLQTGTTMAGKGDAIAIAALGDDAMLAIGRDEPEVELIPLDARGERRGASSTILDWTSQGHTFLTADPGADRFLLLTTKLGQVGAWKRHRDGSADVGPVIAFDLNSEGAVGAVIDGGYALLTGSGTCDFVQLDDALVPGDRRQISSTCHHPDLVNADGAEQVVAAWNCDNDRVWANAGTILDGLNATDTEVYTATMPPPANPRLARGTEGIWYAFSVGPDQLAVALLDGGAQPVADYPVAIVHADPALAGYDLGVHGDDSILLWAQGDPSASLYALRLCVPPGG